MTPNCVIFFHDDLDGIASAAIVLKAHPEAECIAVNYGDDWKAYDVSEANIFVVDFSFPDMSALAARCKELHWVDHHRSAMDRQLAAWNSDAIAGLRSLNLAGCELTWNYLYPETEMPEIIRLVGDMDMWEFSYENTRSVCEALHYKNSDPGSIYWQTLIDSVSPQQVEWLRIDGDVLIQAKTERVAQLFDRGIDVTFFGHSARLMNATTDISTLGEFVYLKDDYDVAVMYQVINTDVILSFRSNSVDVRKIAESFGGGGHTAASGATVDFQTLLDLYNGKYKEAA